LTLTAAKGGGTVLRADLAAAVNRPSTEDRSGSRTAVPS